MGGAPSSVPTHSPSVAPTPAPTQDPSSSPTAAPTQAPTAVPTQMPRPSQTTDYVNVCCRKDGRCSPICSMFRTGDNAIGICSMDTPYSVYISTRDLELPGLEGGIVMGCTGPIEADEEAEGVWRVRCADRTQRPEIRKDFPCLR